jgi:HEAT repeat protein
MRSRVAVSVSILALLALGIGLLIHSAAPSGEAVAATKASKTVSDAVKVIESQVAQNVKMMAFEAIRKSGGTDAIQALVKLTKSKDLAIQAMACSTLARMKKAEATTELKKLVKDSSKKTALRTAAMNALSRGGTSADRAWVASYAKNHSRLKGQYAWLSKQSFYK